MGYTESLRSKVSARQCDILARIFNIAAWPQPNVGARSCLPCRSPGEGWSRPWERAQSLDLARDPEPACGELVESIERASLRPYLHQNRRKHLRSEPILAQSPPPLRSLICTRFICQRWSQDMRASSLSGFAIPVSAKQAATRPVRIQWPRRSSLSEGGHAAKQTADAVWVRSEYFE